MRIKVSPIDIVELLLKLDFDLKSRRAIRSRDPNVVSPLIYDTEGGRHRVSLVVEGHDLHDVGVAYTDGCGMCQRYYMLVIFRLTDQGDHFKDVVVKHQHDKCACLS